MTMGYIVLQNLRRNRLRTALTLVAFALPMGIFVLAISVVGAMIQISKLNEQQLRLGVHQKCTLINPLPDALRRKIEALDVDRKRLTAVCGMRWFGGKLPGESSPIQSLAADADTFPLLYPELQMTPEEIQEWNKDNQAAVVGYGVVEQFKERFPNFKLGGRVTLKSSVPPYLELDFNIVKIAQATNRAMSFHFRRDYLTKSLEEAGEVGAECNIFWVKCNGADDLHHLQIAIDQEFANSPNETKSEDENAFYAGFTKALGDLPSLMSALTVVVLLIVGLVGGNTMMMSIRERTSELGVFKAIGFLPRRIFAIVLAESVVLAAMGAVMGIVPVWLGVTLFPIRKIGNLPIANLTPSINAAYGSLVTAIVIGAIAGFWPALQAMRLRTVDALRRVA